MRTRRRLLLLALVGIWLGGFEAVKAAPARAILCESVCGDGATCDSECWLTQFEFDQDYPPTSCGAEGYSCCGDDVCDVPVEGCSSALCQDDCGDVSSQCGGDGPCDFGEVLNGSDECVEIAPEVPLGGGGTCGGECTSNDDCCGNDVCQSEHGSQGQCAISSEEICEDSPSCSSNLQCDQWAATQTQCGSGTRPVYCDPGIDRCQFKEGFDCPDSGTICQ